MPLAAGMDDTSIRGELRDFRDQSEIQIWNDAVAACRAAAWAEVEAMEAAAADGMPHPARSVVRAVGSMHRGDDERLKVAGLAIEDLKLNWHDDHPKARCTCSTCWPDYPYFRVCPDCGNKRCPKAKHHDHACTNSNEPGQTGSIYE